MVNQFPMGGGGSRPKLIITGNSGPGSLYEVNDTLSIADDTLILESQKGDTPDWTPEGGGLTTASTFVATSAASLLVEYAGLTKIVAKSQGAITVSGLADQTAVYGETISIDASSAFSGMVTTYSIVSGPVWLSINPETGAITGTAPGSNVTVLVTVRASNNAGSVTDAFSITVAEGVLALQTNGAGYILQGYSAGNVTFTVGEEDFIVDPQAVIGQPPMFLASEGFTYVDVDTSGGLNPGDDMTIILPATVFDPDGAVPEISWKLWNSLNDDIATDTRDYTVLAGDSIDVFGVKLTITATNSFGTTQTTVDIVEAPEYTEQSLSFAMADPVNDPAPQLIKTTGISDGGYDANNWLMVINFRYGDRPFQLPDGRTPGTYDRWIQGYQQNADNKIFRLYSRNEYGDNRHNYHAPFGGSEPMNTTDRYNMLAFAGGTSLWTTLWGGINGQEVVAYEKKSGTTNNTAGKMITSEQIIIGLPEGEIFDMRIWLDPVGPDVEFNVNDPAVRRLFFNEDGTSRNPAEAEAVYGLPDLVVPLTAADANNLVNRGKSNNFDQIQGVFL